MTESTLDGQPRVDWYPLIGRSRIELTGNDRAKFLHNFCTQEIKSLPSGSSCEAFITNVKGRILGHVFIHADDNALLLDTVTDQEAALIAHLDRYLISEDVTLRACGDEWHIGYFTGPDACSTLARLNVDVSSLAIGQHRPFAWNGISVILRRLDWFGEPGFMIDVPREHVKRWQDALSTIGISDGEMENFTAHRIRAGLPHYGVDLTDENLAQEAARTATAISFKKGCYLGQEPIARIDALGHVNRELRSLVIDSVSTIAPGAAISLTDDDQPIARVTSSARFSSEGKTYAMTILPNRFALPGTTVRIEDSSKSDRLLAKVIWSPLEST